MTFAVVSSDVASPRMISTSFITGTGFMKCMPMTFSGRPVRAAISVMEIELVFVARMALGPAILSRSLKILNFRSRFSVAASTMRAASDAASSAG